MCKFIFNFIRHHVRGYLILALLWSDTLMGCAFFVLQAYLTDVWKLSFTHAAAIVNIWEGTSLMLPAVFQFIADKYTGNFKVVVMCSISSALGLGLVTMSLPPVLGDESCKKYEPECIGNKQKGLLYLGVALTAIGRGGLRVCVPDLYNEQSVFGEYSLCGFLRQQGCNAGNIAIYAVGTLIISLITSWTYRFGFPAIFAAYVTLTFLGGWTTYTTDGPKHKGSLLAKVFNVFTSTCEEDQVSPEESNFIRHIAAVSITFIIIGIVSALANTFFVEQANHMNRKIWFITIPLAAFQLPMLTGSIVRPCLSLMFEIFRYINIICRCCIPLRLRIIPSKVIINQALLNAILCCMVAGAVEKRRLRISRSHPGVDIVPMHATWLIFQFYLVSCVDVFFRTSIDAYYHSSARGDLPGYYAVYTDFMSGLGFVCSVILVAVVGDISERGDKDQSWFEKSVNTSRLDLYYWLLAVLGCVSLGAFSAMVRFGIFKDVKAADVNRERDGSGEHSSCCFCR